MLMAQAFRLSTFHVHVSCPVTALQVDFLNALQFGACLISVQSLLHLCIEHIADAWLVQCEMILLRCLIQSYMLVYVIHH